MLFERDSRSIHVRAHDNMMDSPDPTVLESAPRSACGLGMLTALMSAASLARRRQLRRWWRIFLAPSRLVITHASRIKRVYGFELEDLFTIRAIRGNRGWLFEDFRDWFSIS